MVDKKGKTQIRVELLDRGPDAMKLPEAARGKTFDVITTTYMCQADRYAFERHFNEGTGMLVGLSDLFVEKTDGDGKPVLNDEGEKQFRIAEGRDGGDFHETHIGFFAWRALSREIPELAESSFETFAGAVLELEIHEDEDADRVDPPKVPQPA